MTAVNLGRLQKVPLRDAWSSESIDFTPWLAQEENLKLLGDTIGLELEAESQEEEVGPYRADILCRDIATDQFVLIENQLERTDHVHLGQLLTYGAGLDAVTIVWIAARFNEEHRAALDWLNEHTDETIKLWGLEVELWRIEGSPIAPKFSVISKPNDWSRTMKGAAGGGPEVTKHKQLQQQFWTDFRSYMEAHDSFVRCQKPSPHHWMRHAAGRAGVHFNSIASIWNSRNDSHSPEIRVELVVETANAKRDFAYLERQKDDIETALEFPLTWHSPKDTATSKAFTRQDADWLDRQEWEEQFQWLRQRLEKMHTVFAPIVKNLGIEVAE